jgi:hypothetical protein
MLKEQRVNVKNVIGVKCSVPEVCVGLVTALPSGENRYVEILKTLTVGIHVVFNMLLVREIK